MSSTCLHSAIMSETDANAGAGVTSIAERLAIIRKARGLSRAEAARLAGKHARWLESYEQGAVEPPEAALELLGKVYGLHPAVLRYGEGDYLKVPALMAAAADQIDEAARRLADIAAHIRNMPFPDQALASMDEDLVTPTGSAGGGQAARRRAGQGKG